MKKTRFTETQIVAILKKQEAGIKTSDLCREYGGAKTTRGKVSVSVVFGIIENRLLFRQRKD